MDSFQLYFLSKIRILEKELGIKTDFNGDSDGKESLSMELRRRSSRRISKKNDLQDISITREGDEGYTKSENELYKIDQKLFNLKSEPQMEDSVLYDWNKE